MYKPKDCVCEVGSFKAEQLFVCLSSRFTIRPPHCEDAPLTAAAPLQHRAGPACRNDPLSTLMLTRKHTNVLLD